MEDKKKEYTNGDLTVVWQPEKCIHSGICVNGLSEVFKPQEKPWIQMDNSTSDKIKAQVNNCPSGALRFYMNDKTAAEVTNETSIEIVPNGPLIVHGTIKVKDKDGNTEIRINKSAFCRCGASSNKPYCDGTHKRIDFTD